MATSYPFEEHRGWIVHPVYDGDAELMNVLTSMTEDPEAPGHSDVGVQNILYAETLNTRPRRVLEIGTHIGTAAVIIGRALKRNGYGRLLTLEPQVAGLGGGKPGDQWRVVLGQRHRRGVEGALGHACPGHRRDRVDGNAVAAHLGGGHEGEPGERQNARPEALLRGGRLL